MKYGLWCKTVKDWMMDSRTQVSLWESEKEADKWRRNHTVHPDNYETKAYVDQRQSQDT
jgi:hypothetical protein